MFSYYKAERYCIALRFKYKSLHNYIDQGSIRERRGQGVRRDARVGRRGERERRLWRRVNLEIGEILTYLGDGVGECSGL